MRVALAAFMSFFFWLGLRRHTGGYVQQTLIIWTPRRYESAHLVRRRLFFFFQRQVSFLTYPGSICRPSPNCCTRQGHLKTQYFIRLQDTPQMSTQITHFRHFEGDHIYQSHLEHLKQADRICILAQHNGAKHILSIKMRFLCTNVTCKCENISED